MTIDEQYIFRILFQNRILNSDGNAFQKLFVSVMTSVDKNFSPVKPHGKNGDRKNDGFNKINGSYYQVYAPEDSKITHSDAIKKCKTDFNGLKLYWEKITPIKHFYFVLNDKYNGGFPELYKTLSELALENKGINFDPFLSKDLEDKFINLSEEDMVKIVGLCPNLNAIEQLDYSLMNVIIKYLLEKMVPYSADENYSPPDFEEKIKFNNLSSKISTLLTLGTYQRSVLDDYFEKSSAFLKKDVRNSFKKLYEESKSVIGNVKNKEDNMFMYILEKSCPQASRGIQDAVLVLMSYYFESCDIFEEPKKK